MARTFNGSNQYLGNGTAIVSAAPLTLACWFNVVNITANHTLVSIGDTAGDDNYFRIYAAGADAGDFVKFDARNTTLRTAVTSAAYSANTWQHACGVAVSTGDRTIYLNAANAGTNLLSITPAGLDVSDIGRLGRATPTQFCNGSIAMVGIWNVALSQAEVAQLAAGFSPSRVRPQSLISCPPLVREIIDLKGIVWTDNNTTTVSPGPRQYAL
jgi:hypothetical protein